jgi:hypothetical protein
MLRSLARVVLFPGIAILALASPIAASAAGGGGGGGSSNGMTITVGSPITLQDRLLVTIPVTVSCVDSITTDPAVTQPGSLIAALDQAQGKSVSQGFGGIELDSCSPTPQTFALQVTPVNGLAFHNGTAIVSVSGVICDFFVFPEVCDSATTPWQTIKL